MVVIENVCKRFGAFQALTDVSGEARRGQVIVLCGPSGSGKSTLIRTINHLAPPDSGRVTVEGVNAAAKGVNLNAYRKSIGFVAQQFNLFPHLTALENVAIGLHRLCGMRRRDADEAAMGHLRRIGLEDRAGHYPADLSGGQKQRVAIIRALAMDPSVLLLDEPTSALDPEMIGEVLSLLRSLTGSDRAILCVTHEVGFAREMADIVWFMDRGRLIEAAPPAQFFSDPQHPRAREFVTRLHGHG
jgi:polar amino acid transport system ATP-binding protein